MTVGELIKQLRKLPGDAKVAFRDHDQSEAEINNWASRVTLEPSACLERMYRADATGDYFAVIS